MVGNRSLIFSPNLRCLWCKRCKLDQGIINLDMFGMKGPPKIEHCRVIRNMSIWGLICNKKTPKKYPRSVFFSAPISEISSVKTCRDYRWSSRSIIVPHLMASMNLDREAIPNSLRFPFRIWWKQTSQQCKLFSAVSLLRPISTKYIFKLAYILHNTQGLRDSM